MQLHRFKRLKSKLHLTACGKNEEILRANHENVCWVEIRIEEKSDL